jgi:hypothetical protein
MSWEQGAMIAEVVSAIAVVISLIYVAVQIRANTREARANAFQLAIQSEMDVAGVFAEHAATWDRVVKGEPIPDGAERRLAILLFNLLMLDSERRYRQFASGYLQAQSWDARHQTLPLIVRLPIFRDWRESLGAKGHSPDFLQIVDECATRGSEFSDEDSTGSL